MGRNDAVKTEERAAQGSELSLEGVEEIISALRGLLADVFTLYLKTKNFHWHMSGRHFRDYHLLLDEHGDQLFAMTDEIAERARKIGGTTLHSIGDISRHQRLADNNQELVSAEDMLAELLADSRRLTGFLRQTHEICGGHGDVATTSLIEVWIDQTERRTWFWLRSLGGCKSSRIAGRCRWIAFGGQFRDSSGGPECYRPCAHWGSRRRVRPWHH